jgi:hypothetical protein
LAGADLIEGVEPFDEGFGLLAVFEALVELVAKRVREVCSIC